jgi:tripartite-type tricarboxylate transporter receptor subunit TctC
VRHRVVATATRPAGRRGAGATARALAVLLAWALALPAPGQDVDRRTNGGPRSPDWPIVLIVPFPDGGSAARVGRTLAQTMGEALGRTVTTRNIAAGTGVEAMNEVARLDPGEIRLGYATSTQLIQGTLVSRPSAYNPGEDFDWIGVVGTFGNAVVVGAGEKAATFDEWLADLPRRPRPPRWGAGAATSMSLLAARFLADAIGVPVEIVNYDSADASYAALRRGEIDATFDGLPNALEETPRSGGRIIALSSRARADVLPVVPAFGEKWPGEDFSVFVALVVSRKETETVRARLKSGWYGVNRIGEARRALHAIGIDYLGLDSEAAPAFIDAEFLRHAKLFARASAAR